VKMDDVVLVDPAAEFEPEALHGVVLQVGKRRFLRVL
jgi:hypothetical protein